ncbi:rho-type GTPase-activating protein 2 [Monosporozyma unispora]
MDSVETNNNTRLDPGRHSRQFSFDNINGLMMIPSPPTSPPPPPPTASTTLKTTSEKICSQCHDPIEDGKIYEMDGFQWHEHCFFCSRCHKTLTNNNEFITLPNDKDSSCSLICNDCSKNCQHCGKPINDMAIILSSNEAYCQECFKCYKCGEQIKDLKYVKTKKGLYCINCHKRLLAKRQLYKERQLRHQQQLQQQLSPVKSDTSESTETLTLPKRSSMRPRNNDLNHHNKNIHRHSRSLSNTQHIKVDEVAPDSNTNVKIHSRRPSDESEGSNKANHSRSMSLDDVLNATLQNDGFSSDDDNNTENSKTVDKVDKDKDRLPSPIHETNLEHLITPTNSMSSSSISTIPTNNNINNVNTNNATHSDNDPSISIKSKKGLLDVTETHNVNPLLKTPELKQKPANNNKTINLPLNSPMSTLNTDPLTSPNKNKILSTSTAMNNNRNNQFIKTLDMIQTSNPSNKGLALEFSDTNEKISNMMKSVSNNQIGTMARNDFIQDKNNTNNGNNGSKKLGRSLSLKSKNFFSHWKSKGHNHSTSDSNKKIDQHTSPRASVNINNNHNGDDDFDTHSGWGVSPPSGMKSNTASPIPAATMTTTSANSTTFTRHSSRGKSDTLIYNSSKASITNDQSLTTPRNQHQRNNSNSWTDPKSTSGVAMFRTPPLNNQTIFRRLPNAGPSGMSHSTNSSISKPMINVSESVDTNIKLEGDESITSRSNSPALHGRSASWQSPLFNNGKKNMSITEENVDSEELKPKTSVKEDDDDEEEGEDEDEDDIEIVELKLRKLKLELKEMEVTKQKLNIEIDNLKSHKDELVNDINKLRETKQKYYDINSSPSKFYNEEFSNDGTTLKGTSSMGPDGSKPKFWKLFSNSNSSHNNSSNNPGIGNTGSTMTTGGTISQRSLGSNITNFSNNIANASDTSLMTSVDSTNSRNNINTTSFGGGASNNGSSSYNLTLSQYCYKNGNNESHIPDIIIKCIDFIEMNKKNLETEGIYRKSGSQSLIEEVERRLYLNHDDLDFSVDDIHVVANVLKRFLRRLSDPIISFEIYDPLISLVKDNNLIMNLPLSDNSNVELDSDLFEFIKVSITKLLQQLPVENLEVLKLLIKHINLVAQYDKFNLMNLHNLTLVFTPSLIHDITGERDMIDMKERNYIVEFILLHRLV